jgi:hypothetical protein
MTQLQCWLSLVRDDIRGIVEGWGRAGGRMAVVELAALFT